MSRLRIYCETLPFEEVVRARTLSLLVRHPFEIVLAVRPWQLEALPRVVRTLRDAGIGCSVWPMLDDAEGRWASAHNATSFVRLLHATADTLEQGLAPATELLLDLEPPFAHAQALAVATGSGTGNGSSRLRDLARLAPRGPSASDLARASGELASAVAALHARGIATAAAVWPLVALDPLGEQGWQSLLGTPVDALATGRVSVMMYTTIFEGWSRGALRRRDATALLSAATSRAMARWKDAAGMSLVCVGTGALVDEPTYRDPSELAEDASLARAAGCHDLSLFDLGGVLARAPAEAWLDAFAHGEEPSPLAASKRVRLARRVARVATWVLRRR